MRAINVELQLVDERAIWPTQAYAGDAGWDLPILHEVCVRPQTGVDVRTGIAVAIPEGWFGRIVGRSSTFRKRGLLVVEGIIDAGFRGELFSYVYNPGKLSVFLDPGQSVAQLLFHQVPAIEWYERRELPISERGLAGFGSSGH